jgi:xanthine dehydrogenase large subunit
VSREAAHESAVLHVTGAARYTDDLDEVPGTLHAAIGLARQAHARIEHLDLDAVRAMPGVQGVFGARHIRGANRLGIIVADEPLLAEDTCTYWGQPLFVVVALTREQARRAAALAVARCTPLPAVLDPEQARAVGLEVVPGRTAVCGDPAAAMSTAAVRVQGRVDAGGQEHFYLEGQVAYAVPGEQGRLTVHAATQHPSEMQQMVAKVLGCPSAAVTVLCRRMGGAFGGKESQSSITTCLAALAAHHTGRPVKLRLDRDDDMLATGKRHAFRIGYAAGAGPDGRIVALDLDHLVDCGHSADYSGPVADRAVFHATNAYQVPALRCTSFRARTHRQSATAFRGFGGPQAVLGMETAIEHLAHALGRDALDVRKANLLGPANGQRLHYGFELHDNVLPELVEQLEQTSRYRARRRDVAASNRCEPVLRRGLCLMPSLFGVGFGATFLNQAGALVQVYTDGSVAVNHGGTEMGQGLYTKVAQVVADELGVPLAQVLCSATDTGKVPNTVSTAASSGADLNGMAALKAARTLRERLAPVAARLLGCEPAQVRFAAGQVSGGGRSAGFAAVCAQAFVDQVSLSATGFHRVPKVGYDFATLQGRPFLYHTYGAACTEVVVDTLTGESRVLRVDILQDVGRSLNPALDRGQVEGGFVQGMGWLTTEELVWAADGRLATASAQTYKIPSSRDVPPVFEVELFERANVEETVGRSKAIGEPPLHLAVSVHLALLDALRQAAPAGGFPRLRAPATPEAVLQALDALENAAG